MCSTPRGRAGLRQMSHLAPTFSLSNYLKLSGRLQAPCINIPSEPQGLGASDFIFYYIIQQGEELTCLHFFKWSC